MALNRDKFRNIVGGITTPQAEEPVAAVAAPSAVESAKPEKMPPAEGQGRQNIAEPAHDDGAKQVDMPRFAKRGRPKGRKDEPAASKGRKVKVSLFLSEVLVNDLYDWAHQDRMHPGEMFERALKPFHEKEAKRRNAGKE